MIPDNGANEKHIARPTNPSESAAELEFWADIQNLARNERATEDDSGKPTFEQIRARLSASVTGHRDVIDQLALVFDPRWARGITPHPLGATTSQAQAPSVRERILVIGSSGSGKSHLMQALGRSLEIPCVIIDASAISESGWQGMQPADVLAQLYAAVGQDHGVLERGELLLVLDEIDKVCPTSPNDYLGAAVRRGRQQSLLSLLGGVTPVRFPLEDELRRVTWMEVRTDQIPIIAAGAFPGLEMRGAEPTDAELISYGMLPELASRLSTRLVLESRTTAELAAMWQAPGGLIAQLEAATRRIGYTLRISDGAVSMTARAVVDGGGAMTSRGGASIISGAVRRAVIRALSSAVPTTDFLVIAPDDIIGQGGS